MENLISTLISLLLLAGVGGLIYILYHKRKPDTINKSAIPLSDIFTKHSSTTPDFEDDYALQYNTDNIGDTLNDIALKVYISDRNGNNMTESFIYADHDLVTNYITIGRGKNNNYRLNSRYVDSEAALFVAKSGQKFMVKAKPNSKNGIKYDYISDDKITDTIEFSDEVTLFMGPIKMRFVSAYCKVQAHRNNGGYDRMSIFGNDSTTKTIKFNQ